MFPVFISLPSYQNSSQNKMTPFRRHPLATYKPWLLYDMCYCFLKFVLDFCNIINTLALQLILLYCFYYHFTFLLSIHYGHFQENFINAMFNLWCWWVLDIFCSWVFTDSQTLPLSGRNIQDTFRQQFDSYLILMYVQNIALYLSLQTSFTILFFLFTQ